MKYHDLRDFLAQLEKQGELKRVGVEVSPRLEMTEICDRVLKAGGPAILFEKPAGHTIPVLGNLFGTPRRVALGMGQDSLEALREVGKLLAYLKEPDPPKGLKDAWDKERRRTGYAALDPDLPSPEPGPDRASEQAFVTRLTQLALARARTECADSGMSDHWAVF